MSIFEKKFQELLESSPENKALKTRVAALESQVSVLTKALSDAMHAYTNLAKITIDNRKSLEEVLAYMTEPLGDMEEQAAEDPAPTMTPEELAAYKRNLN